MLPKRNKPYVVCSTFIDGKLNNHNIQIIYNASEDTITGRFFINDQFIYAEEQGLMSLESVLSSLAYFIDLYENKQTT